MAVVVEVVKAGDMPRLFLLFQSSSVHIYPIPRVNESTNQQSPQALSFSRVRAFSFSPVQGKNGHKMTYCVMVW